MNIEVEARFLDVDKQYLVKRLIDLDAIDKGEVTLTETIFYDQANEWPHEGRFVRIRSAGSETKLTYKHNKEQAIDSAKEIELAVSDPILAAQLLEMLGLVAFRHQEKRRHTFLRDGVVVDIDTWPTVPAYVELEGRSEPEIRLMAKTLGFDWSEAVFDDARAIIQERYNIPLGDLRWFTFDRVE